MNANNFSNRLRRSRMSAGLQGKDLAQRLGISRPYLTQLEKGQRVPSEDLLNRLARELKVSTYWLLHGDHANHPRLAPKELSNNIHNAATSSQADKSKECPRCAKLEAELREARAVIRDQAAALAAALSPKPSPAAVRACGVVDGGRETRRGA